MRAVAPLVLVTLLLAGCGGGAQPLPNEAVPLAPAPACPTGLFFPEYDAGAALTGETAAGEAGGIDLSGAAQGHVTAVYTGGQQARFLMEKDGVQSSAALAGDGEARTFSLTMGDGTYRLAVMLPLGDGLYTPLVETFVEVALADEWAPYTVPNHMVPYAAGTPAHQLAKALAATCPTGLELALAAFTWLGENIAYDEALYAREQQLSALDGGYRPDLSRMLEEGTGVCGDYAALFAALLRLNGVPCQVVHGTVDLPGEGPAYHAWNLAWLPGPDDGYGWVHFDPTFAHSESEMVRQALGLPRVDGVVYGPASARY